LVKVTKGATHISGYKILKCKQAFNNNISYSVSTEGAFDTLIDHLYNSINKLRKLEEDYV
jgi:hypothetical protein